MANKIPLGLYTAPNQVRELDAADKLDKSAMPTDTVYTAGAQTLTDKTLASNTIASALNDATRRLLDLSGSGGTGTTCDRVQVTAQAAGNNAIVGVASSATNANLELRGKGSGTVVLTGSGDVVGTTGAQTLSNKILTAPAISDFTSATHNHQGTSGGGTLDTAAIASGTMSQDRLADVANRSGIYAAGVGSRVLVSNGTAAGSGGVSGWQERSRVVQVQAATFTRSGTNTASAATFSLFQRTLANNDDFSFVTTPDCVVDTTGGATPTLSTSTGRGKVIRVALAGRVTTSVARNFNITCIVSPNGGVSTNQTTLTCASLGPVTLAQWRASATFVYHSTQGTTGTFVHWIDEFKVIQASTVLEGTGVAGWNTASYNFATGQIAQFRVQFTITGGAGADVINCDSAIWEVLN